MTHHARIHLDIIKLVSSLEAKNTFSPLGGTNDLHIITWARCISDVPQIDSQVNKDTFLDKCTLLIVWCRPCKCTLDTLFIARLYCCRWTMFLLRFCCEGQKLFFFFFFHSAKSWLDRTRIITSLTLAVLWSIGNSCCSSILVMLQPVGGALSWYAHVVLYWSPLICCLHAQTLYTIRILRVQQTGAWDFKFLLQICPITKVWHHHLFLS